MNNKSLIGRIKLLQVQSEPLKTGEHPNRTYDPSALNAANQIKVNPDGVTAILDDGNKILDVHHADHPRSRNTGRGNGISIGFTGHYEAMRGKFGDHLWDGIAGENIIILSSQPFSAEELSGGIVIRNEKTGVEKAFRIPSAMAPCDEFSHYVNKTTTRMPAEKLKATLQFLDKGRRGFIAIPEDLSDFNIYNGDTVFLIDG